MITVAWFFVIVVALFGVILWIGDHYDKQDWD